MENKKQKIYPFGISKDLFRLNVGMGLALFFIVVLTAAVISLFAASVTSRKDTMSNQAVNGTSTHTISFTLSTGNTFASGEQIAIDFPHTSAFTQGGTWTTADFTFNDGTARTVDAVAAGAGTSTVSCTNAANNVGVAIDTTTLVFRVIPCGALYTPSGPTATVTFGIFGAAPNGTLTNPSTPGSYTINIANGAGDCLAGGDNCTMAVPIVDASTVGVTATVTAVCGNGAIEGGEQCDDGNTASGDGCSSTCQNEGGGGPPPDTTPPVISNIQHTNITGTSARITWDTNESSDSTVNYGLTASYGSTVNNTSLVLQHTIDLTGLSQNTLYHYQVCSRDGAGNQACSGDRTFTTLDTTPPVISNVQVTNIQPTQVTVTWTTNEAATSFVDYGLSAGPPYSNTAGDATLVTSHSVNVTGLTASTTYHYRVRSGDAASNESFTSDATFTTAAPPDTTPPVISNIQVSNITATSATITWTTDEASDSKVDYDTVTGPPYANTTTNAAMVTSHSINLTGLTSQTTYHFRVRSSDASANEAASGDNTFTTADVTAPIISNVQVSGITGTSATVTWTTNEQATNFVDYGLTAGPPYSNTAGSAAPLQTSHSVNLTGLTSETTYHFRVRSADASNNEATTGDLTFTTADTTPPVISNVQSSNITTTGARITWTTNEASDSIVEYGPTTSYGSQTSSSAMVTSHQIDLTGLTPGTLYHYRVKSKDAANNQATSGDFTFTTQTPPDTTPPVISNVQVSGITSDSATITWTTDEPATSFVDYGLTAGPPYSGTAGNATLVTSHSVNVTGLTAETTYHYRVRSADAAANSAATSDATFTTTDVSAPTISGVQVTNITETSATVSWTTNEPATSFVDYGLSAGPPYTDTAGNATMVTSHSVNLTGLTPSTTYHYRVRSADPQGNESTTPDATFSTVDSTPPVISSVQATNITQSGARITWTTNEPSDSVVEYGLTTAYGSQLSNAAMVTSHQIDITGLAADTTYHFRVKSKDAADNQATSGDNTFTTLKPPPPVISNIQVTNITQTSARVTWTTDVASDSKVDFGFTTAYGETRADGAMVTSHQIDLTGLVKNKLYHFRVRSQDAFAQETTSTDQTFNTAPDTTPPANVTSFTATAGNQVVNLSWTNPPDPDFVRVKILRKVGADPVDQNDGVEIYNGTGTSTSDTGLTNGVTYHYGAFAYDDVPNYASGAFANATPAGAVDTTPPPEVQNFSATPGNQEVTLNWQNPSDPDWVGVRIMRKTGSYATGPNDGTMVYSGNTPPRLDTGLTNGITYYYKAFSYDGALNYSAGVEAQATPVAPPDSTPPNNVTDFTAVAGDAIVQLTWQNPTNPDWAGTRIIRKLGGNPSGPNDGIVVYDGTGDNKLDTGLTNGVTYYYGAYTYDPTPNFSSGVFANATPTEGAPPPPPPACTDSDGGKSYEVQGTVTTEDGSSFTDSCADQQTVNENFCDAGSRSTEAHACGDGFKCSAGRCTAATPEPPTERCGNGICGGAENSINCPIDCPVAPTEPPPPPQQIEGRLRREDVKFYATTARIELRVDDGDIRTYTGMTIFVYLPDASIRKPLKSAYVSVGGKTYAMKQVASQEATVITPSSPGRHPLRVVVNYQDGASDAVDFTLVTDGRGIVYEVVDGKDTPIPGARVTLLVDTGGGNFGVWNGGPSSQTNPQTTDDVGRYSFIVPRGTYKLKADKEGYLPKETLPFPIGDENVITSALLLVKRPTDLQETIAAAGQLGAEQVREITQNPIVEQQTEQVAAPAVAAIAVANVATAGAATATAIPYLLYLYSLLAHPALLIARRRRQKWGVVYNALTKLPIDLAIVRLLDAKTGRIIRSAVTDKDGRYFFIIQKGEYKITAVKAGYVFPSVYLKGKREDAHFIDLYHGETIVVREETTITANIPLDPVTVEKTPRKIMLEGIGRRFQKSIGLLSIAAMTIAAIITPKPIIIGLLIGNVLMYLLFRRLAVPPKPKNWGIVYDEKTGKPVQNAVARIFEAKFNKLLETQVTDAKGRYAFLVGHNVYYVTFEKPGYQKQQKGPIDLLLKEKQKVEAQIVAVDIKLPPAEGGAPTETKKSMLPPPGGQTPPTPTAPPATPPTTPPPPPSPITPMPPRIQPSAAPPAAPPPAASKVPWEVQMLQRLKKTPDAGPTPAPTTPPSAPPPTPPASSMPAAPTPVPPAAPAARIPWELQALQKMKEAKSEPVKPAEPKPAIPPTPPAAPPAPAVMGKAGETKLIQDAEHAHPEEAKNKVQDATSAHPGEQRHLIKPAEEDNVPGPDDAVKEL